MNGETDLSVLLHSLRPVCNEGVYVFCTVSREQFAALNVSSVCTFAEAEGITLLLAQADADAHGLPYRGLWAWITLSVHSALDAVGLLAAVSAALADAHLPANTVSAFYHDHLFVPHAERERALAVLDAMTQ